MPAIAEKWINIFNNNATWNDEKVIEGVKWCYEASKLSPPREVVICDSPADCQIKANHALGRTIIEHIEPSSYLSYSDCGWVSFHDFFDQIGVSEDEDFRKFRDLMENGVYYSILFDEMAFVSKPPVAVLKNEDDALHCVDGPALYFSDGYGMYSVNGREVEDELIEDGFTFEDFQNEENEDIRACMITIIKEREGDAGLLKFLGAEMVDEKTITHNDKHSETHRLYKTKEVYDFIQDHKGRMGQPYCWSEMVCPSTGQTYLIENSAAFDDAIEAAKFLRPAWVPADLPYTWTQFAN